MVVGMMLNVEDVLDLWNRLNEIVDNMFMEEDFIFVQEVDFVCGVEDIIVESIIEMNLLFLFGMLNLKLYVFVENVVLEDVCKIGVNKNYVKMMVRNELFQFDCVGFNKGEFEEGIVLGLRILIVGEMFINEWNNRKKLQLMIKDVVVFEWQLFDLRGKWMWEDIVFVFLFVKWVIVFFKEDLIIFFQIEDFCCEVYVISFED